MSTDADKEYLKKHGIPQLFNDITQDLFKDKPENPVQYIIELLKKKKAERDGTVGKQVKPQEGGGSAPSQHSQPAAE
jgi:hypothetical protein